MEGFRWNSQHSTDDSKWWTSETRSYSGGNYSSDSTTVHSKGAIKGEWIQILSKSVGYRLDNITLWHPDIDCCVDRFPQQFSVLGGYNCTAWQLLTTVTDVLAPERGESYTHEMESVYSFNCYRVVITSLRFGAEGYMELAELEFYGTIESIERPTPQHNDSWYRSPSYPSRSIPSLTEIQLRMASFESSCDRRI